MQLMTVAHYWLGSIEEEIYIQYDESNDRTYVFNTEKMTVVQLPFYEADVMTEILDDYDKDGLFELCQACYDYFKDNIDNYDLTEEDKTWLLENINVF